MAETNISTDLYWDSFGDVRCVQCLNGLTGENGYERIIEADVKTLGEITHAFGNDLTCVCGRVVYNPGAGVTQVAP